MAKRYPTAEQLQRLRRVHMLRETRETMAFRLGWPDKAHLFYAAWHGSVIQRSSWQDWSVMLLHVLPVVATNGLTGEN